jgi:prostatic aicd phosphatase
VSTPLPYMAIFIQTDDIVQYKASSTAITALGAQQQVDLGRLLRSLYFNSTSPSHIEGISPDVFNQDQVHIQADAGGEGGVIFNSAVALTQGLWANTTAFNSTLADGSVVVGPFGGYQYVPSEWNFYVELHSQEGTLIRL